MRNTSWAARCIGTSVIVAIGFVARAQSPAGQAVDDVRSKLHRQAEAVAQQGYRPAAAEIFDRIPAGGQRSFAVQLASGVTNAIIAACGQNCDHVEIALYDHQRQPLGRTPERKDIVALNGNPPTSGLHEVVVSVPGCHASECEIGLVVMRQGPGPQAARDAEYRRYDNRDVDGGDIATFKDVDAVQACESRCSKNAQCRAYSFDRWNHYCFLKSQIGELRLDPRSTTGVRADIPAPPSARREIKMEHHRGRAFPGPGYKTVKAGQFEMCEASCKSDGTCVAYTFKKAEGLCRLYGSAAEYMPDAGSDSGAKVQEPRQP